MYVIKIITILPQMVSLKITEIGRTFKLLGITPSASKNYERIHSTCNFEYLSPFF